MATLGFGLLGSAVAGTEYAAIGGFVGATLGSLGDSFVLFPWLFPQDAIKGARLGDIRFQSAAEGTPMKVSLGPFNLTEGCIIWMSPRRDVKRKKKIGKGQKAEYWEYYQDFAIAFCDTRDIPVSRIRQIWAGDDLIYDNAPGTQYNSIALYYGDQTTPDPTILAHEEEDVPAHKHICYVVLKNMVLPQGVPPLFRARLAQNENMTVGAAIAAIATRNGRIDLEDLDVSLMTDCFNGYTVSGAQTGADMLGPIMIAYTVAVQQRGSTLHFFPRGMETEIPVDLADLTYAGGESSTNVAVPFELEDSDDRSVPSRVMVKFFNPDNDLETGAEPHIRESAVGTETVTFDSNMAFFRDEAQRLARQLAWAAEGERQKIRLTLPPSYVYLLEGHMLTFSYKGKSMRVYVTGVTHGANYLVEVEGVLSPPSLYDQRGEGTADSGSSDIYYPPETVGYVMDLPALTNDEVSVPTVYYGICAADPTAQWQGAMLYWSQDGGTTYEEAGSGTSSSEAQIGYTVVGPGTGSVMTWDVGTEIDIFLYHEASLETVTESECLAGANRIAIRAGETGEWEIIGFTTVTQLSANTFRLTKLLRGLRGTEHLVGVHAPANEPAVVLADDTTIGGQELSGGQLGSPFRYKFPAVGGELSDYASQRIVPRGISCRPFSPVNIRGAWDTGSGDITITWERRSKYNTYVLGSAPPPLASDESPEKYMVELRLGGVASTPLRTFITNTPSVVYTADMQTEDGQALLLTAYHVTVYQVSNIVGQGYPGREVIVP